ncbi:MAG: OmpA family protein [Rhodospirillaceae bacterium]|nr:OmpA family protein [Rhodospirillaceae bacterium]
MLRHFFSAGHFAMRLLSVTIAAVVLIGFVSSASAQLRPWDANNQVMVDLSVLSDNGVGPSPQGRVSLPSLTGDILDPPSRMPRSRLLVKRPPVTGARPFQDLPPVTLKRPGKSSKKRRTARRSSKKPRSRAPKVALNAPPPKPRVKASKPARNLAPAPKARPKPKVNATKAPPPPKVKKPAITAVPKKPAVVMPVNPKPAPQVAARPAAPSTGSHLIFKLGDAKLSGDVRNTLDGLAAKLNATPKSRMQLLAYAGEPNLSASKARRLSLSRALSVRSYLIKKGVRSTRIDVRALGNKVSSGVPNRVDLKVVGK